MNYKELKKDELIDLIEQKDRIIEQQKHLASAVEAKDKEIIEIKEKSKRDISEIKNKAEEEIKNKTKQVDELSQKNTTMMLKEDVERITKNLMSERDKLINIVNILRQNHQDTLRQVKINLDLAISHDELLSSILK